MLYAFDTWAIERMQYLPKKLKPVATSPILSPSTLTSSNLIHLSNQIIDIILPITQIASLDEMLEFPSSEATGGTAELKRPQEVTSLLEVWSDGKDLVDEVLHAYDPILAQVGLDEGVVRQRDSLLVDLSVAPLVDQFSSRFEIRIAICDVRLDHLEHLQRGLGKSNEDTVVDLKEA